MPYREAAYGDCPACGGRLVAEDLARAVARVCDSCGGLWLARADVDDTITYGGYNVDTMAALEEIAARDVKAVDAIAARACPVCGQAMDRENMRNVAVDRCDEHGVWFDHEELLIVLELSTPAGPAFVGTDERKRQRAVAHNRESLLFRFLFGDLRR